MSSCCTSLFLHGLSFTFMPSSLYLITFIIYIEMKEMKGEWPGDDRAKYVAKYSIMFEDIFIIHHRLVSVFGHQRRRTSGDYMEVVLNKKTSLEHVSTKNKFSLYFVFLLGAFFYCHLPLLFLSPHLRLPLHQQQLQLFPLTLVFPLHFTPSVSF